MQKKLWIVGSFVLVGVVFCILVLVMMLLLDYQEFGVVLQVLFVVIVMCLIVLYFEYFGVVLGMLIVWEVDVFDVSGQVCCYWQGSIILVKVWDSLVWMNWDGCDVQCVVLVFGYYMVWLCVLVLDDMVIGCIGLGLVNQVLVLVQSKVFELIEQQCYDVMVGSVVKLVMLSFYVLLMYCLMMQGVIIQVVIMQLVSIIGGLLYMIYYGNLYSQINYSDGGGVVFICKDVQVLQSVLYGLVDVYQYVMDEGLDFLMMFEYNYMYDGLIGINSLVSLIIVYNFYQLGLQVVSMFNVVYVNFFVIYGLEWGVISNGGYMNIFNMLSLLEWEYNSFNQLIGDVFIVKSDYVLLYILMYMNGWIGQFNYLVSLGQFLVNGINFGYIVDGDVVMVLVEVFNSLVFFSNIIEIEISCSSYEMVFNIIFECGYYVVFSLD